MEMTKVTQASQVSAHLQRAAKFALAVGADIHMNAEGDSLLAKFADSDRYHFDPEHVTLHCLEALGQARTFGLVAYSYVHADKLVRGLSPLVVRVVFCNTDVRVQIGASRWYVDDHSSTPVAMRKAILTAFCAYYDEAIAPYTEA